VQSPRRDFFATAEAVVARRGEAGNFHGGTYLLSLFIVVVVVDVISLTDI